MVYEWSKDWRVFDKKRGIILVEGLRRLKGFFIFSFFYMISFLYIENRHVKCYMIESQLDERIPFCEYFVIPYLLWFVFIAAIILYFAFFVKERREFDYMMYSLYIGMTIFIVISLLFPNAQRLRPKLYGRSGFFIDMVKLVYEKDTPTNIFPSIHVFNSIVCCVAVLKNEACKKHVWIICGTVFMTVLIIASTVFIKQHSVIDLAGAFLLNVVVAVVVYKPKNSYLRKSKRVIN